MSSAFESASTEQGGPIARTGFEYQDKVAVSLLLEMAKNSSIQFIECETHDDITLLKSENGQNIVEFVQVKSDTSKTHWTSRDLWAEDCALVPRHMERDAWDETARFRIVTNRDINRDLAFLKQPIASAERVDQSQLL
jgi:hypothetical protein